MEIGSLGRSLGTGVLAGLALALVPGAARAQMIATLPDSGFIRGEDMPSAGTLRVAIRRPDRAGWRLDERTPPRTRTRLLMAQRTTDASVFTKIDADRILRRAAEIEGSEDARTLTVDELRAIAGEAGFGRRAVELAIAEARDAGTADARRPPVRKSGLIITRLSVVREIPVEITSEQLMKEVRLFQPYRDGPPNIKLEEHEVTWRDGKGVCFAVSSVGGVTEIRVYLSKFLIRKGRWIGWVKTAADRLEMLVLLVARRESAGRTSGPPSLPGAGPRGDRDG